MKQSHVPVIRAPYVVSASILAGVVAFVAFMREGVAAGAFAAAAQIAIVIVSAWMLRTVGRWAFLLAPIALLFPAYWAAQSALSLYSLVRRIPLDPRFAMDNADEILPTLEAMYGRPLLGATAAAFLITYLFLAACGWVEGRRAPRSRFGLVLGGMALIGWGACYSQPIRAALLPHVTLLNRGEDETPADKRLAKLLSGEIVSDLRARGIPNGESVFLVQLESVNALALAGVKSGRDLSENSPHLFAAAEGGVLFPHVWGPSVQTHRGMAAILCGSVLDVGNALSKYGSLPSVCLPAVLRAAGYRTAFLSAHWQPEFFNLGSFVREAGFQTQSFATMMKPEDTRLPWGYYDCEFYDRAFDELERLYGRELEERFFGYFEVSANHTPFKDIWPTDAPVPFSHPANQLEHYLNSHSMQDRCLERFFARVAPYRSRAHVIVVGDHSYPVHISPSGSNERGAYTEHFLTSLLYQPPTTRAGEFRFGIREKRPLVAHADLAPTIIEILSGQSVSRSFAAVLREDRSTNTDDCHVLTQPYDGTQISVICKRTKYTYHLGQRKLTVTMLLPDWTESPSFEGAENLGLAEFFDRIMCARYRELLTGSRTSRDLVLLPSRGS